MLIQSLSPNKIQKKGWMPGYMYIRPTRSSRKGHEDVELRRHLRNGPGVQKLGTRVVGASFHGSLPSLIWEMWHKVNMEIHANHVLVIHRESADLNKELCSGDLAGNLDSLFNGIIGLLDWAPD